MRYLNPEWVTAVFTGVLTLATIAYVIFTLLLWRSTKQSADAATVAAESAKSTAEATRVSAEAAKLSADIAAELNRPILGIADVTLFVPENSSWAFHGARLIIVTLRNYGTLYAKRISVEWKTYIDVVSQARNDGRQGPFDLAQGAPCPVKLSVYLSPEDVARIRDGAVNYKVEIQAEYGTPDEKHRWKHRWKYTGVRVFSPPSTFTMDAQTLDRTELIL